MRSNPEPENLKGLQNKKKLSLSLSLTHTHTHTHTQEDKVGLQKLITFLGVCGKGFPLRKWIVCGNPFPAPKKHSILAYPAASRKCPKVSTTNTSPKKETLKRHT
jgi:hypothetical protein